MLRTKEVLLGVLPLLLVSILVSACTNELSVDSVDDEAQSLVVTVEVHQGRALSQQTQSSLSWSQSLSGDLNTTSKFIKYFEAIIPQFQKQVPVSATIRVLKGDKVMYKSSFSSESTQEDHPILFVSGVSAFVSTLSKTLGLKMEPYASKTSKVLQEVWVSCCVVSGIGGYCWGYEGEETYTGFVGMGAQQYGCLCNGTGC